MDGTFIFDSYDFSLQTGALAMRYRFEGGPSFEERVVFPMPGWALSRAEKAALEGCLRLVFLLSGVSYAKAYVPERVVCRAFAWDEPTAQFVQEVWRQGLGEFAYRNGLDLRDRLKFEAATAPLSEPVALRRAPRFLVPVGGGKDSIVTLETLKRAGEPVTLFALGGKEGPAEPIRATLALSGLPWLQVARTLSPELARVNRQGALNGHVPITAILSALALACAALHGHSAVVLSNEASADAPNVTVEGQAVNHQYSKSFAFEQALAGYVHDRISPDLGYFSLLRPLTETAIAQRFARMEAYHGVFRSCNAAFVQNVNARARTWCADCPKCRFVFLALTPFMEKARLAAIFGKNLLGDPAQIQGFADLCGLGAHKPFECVGEIEESAALMARLRREPVWADEPVVAALAPRLALLAGGSAGGGDRALADLLALRKAHRVPVRLLEALRAVG